MEAIHAPRRVGLFIKHLIPFLTFLGHPIIEFGVALGSDLIEKQFQSRPYRADDAKCVINLDD
jgi:hypothetical protein